MEESDTVLRVECKVLSETDSSLVSGGSTVMLSNESSLANAIPGIQNAILTESKNIVNPAGDNKILQKSGVSKEEQPEIVFPTLLTLPRLVISKICSSLSFADKKAMRLLSLSREWSTVMEEEKFIVFRVDVNNASYSAFLKASCLLEIAIIQDVSRKVYCQSQYPLRILNAKLGVNNSPEIISTFLKYGTGRLQYLAISELVQCSNRCTFFGASKELFDLPQFLKGMEFTNLKKLNFQLCLRKLRKNVYSCCDFMELAKLPKIKSFVFHVDHESECGPSISLNAMSKLHSAFYQFLVKHNKSLISLRYGLNSYEKNGFHPQEIPESLLSVLPESTIQEFSLETSSISVYQESMAFLLALGSPLTELKLVLCNFPARFTWSKELQKNMGPIDVIGDDKLLTQVVKKHRNSLEQFEFGSGKRQQLPITLSFLKGCDRLRTLCLKTCFASSFDEAFVLPSLKSAFVADSCHSMVTFIRQHAPNIEHLTCGWLEENGVWPSLKSLNLTSVRPQMRTWIQCQQIIFPELIEFRTNFSSSGQQVDLVRWMITVMPKLELVTIYGMKLDLPIHGVLTSRMTNLKNFSFSGKYDNAVKELCSKRQDGGWTEIRKTVDQTCTNSSIIKTMLTLFSRN